jgi:hypothetical protein
MMLSDQVVDSNCQLYYDHSGPHRNNLYGDINTINGVPFPDIPLGANWQRFRFVNAAMARPYLIKVKTAAGVDVGPQICRVIASDGGYRPDAITFPAEGLLIGVSERYEMVCDFTAYAGQQLYLWCGGWEGHWEAAVWCLTPVGAVAMPVGCLRDSMHSCPRLHCLTVACCCVCIHNCMVDTQPPIDSSWVLKLAMSLPPCPPNPACVLPGMAATPR